MKKLVIGFWIVWSIWVISLSWVLNKDFRFICRRIEGSFLIKNGWGYCEHCYRPWYAVKSHDLNPPYNANLGYGYFFYCEDCWRDSTIGERYVAFLRALEDSKAKNLNWAFENRELLKKKPWLNYEPANDPKWVSGISEEIVEGK